MLINADYASAVAQARSKHQSYVHFDRNTAPTSDVVAPQDKVTLSSAAQAYLNGEGKFTEEAAPTYVKPRTASALLAESSARSSTDSTQESNSRFDQIFQSILDQRLGIDRERLEELEAMMEEIAKNEDMSPEAKEKALEELAKMREKLVQESIEIKNTANATFDDNKENS